METNLLDARDAGTVDIVPVSPEALASLLAERDPSERAWVDATGFEARHGSLCLLPGPAGSIGAVLAGVERPGDPWCLAGLASALPAGSYALACDWEPSVLERAAVGFALGGYRFARYRKHEGGGANLVLPATCDGDRIRHTVRAIGLVRDLINTPAGDLLPEQLAEEARQVAERHGATLRAVVGDRLVAEGYAAIHAVGRAGGSEPRLIDLAWGDSAHPAVTLVGKGVCFDSGGLDIKPAAGMRLMKKDMGGAAHALGLADLIMSERLPVRLRVLIPAVENGIAAGAYRPGDVITGRNGVTMEIDNTDAEGRVVLSDALVDAGADRPELIVDFATLTGAARVALGPELPAMFANDEAVAGELLAAAGAVSDPIWRMPLHAGYREMIESTVADIKNSGSTPFAGAITAALFLERFVPEDVPWVHFDIMAWNAKSRPGRPEGGEAMGLRAVYELLRARYAG